MKEDESFPTLDRVFIEPLSLLERATADEKIA